MVAHNMPRPPLLPSNTTTGRTPLRSHRLHRSKTTFAKIVVLLDNTSAAPFKSKLLLTHICWAVAQGDIDLPPELKAVNDCGYLHV